MVEFFTGMAFIDILACVFGTLAFAVAVICIIKIYNLENGNGKKSTSSKRS